MKTVTAHLLEYTLVHHCGSNKSELARRIGMRRNDFCRIYDRCLAGEGNSLTALEAILKLYFKEGYSLDEALLGYNSDNLPEQGISPCKLCRDEILRIRTQLSNESKEANRKAQVLHSAEQFLAQLEQAFCLGECIQAEDCSDTCPCRRFCDFVKWMEVELEKAGYRCP